MVIIFQKLQVAGKLEEVRVNIKTLWWEKFQRHFTTTNGGTSVQVRNVRNAEATFNAAIKRYRAQKGNATPTRTNRSRSVDVNRNNRRTPPVLSLAETPHAVTKPRVHSTDRKRDDFVGRNTTRSTQKPTAVRTIPQNTTRTATDTCQRLELSYPYTPQPSRSREPELEIYNNFLRISRETQNASSHKQSGEINSVNGQRSVDTTSKFESKRKKRPAPPPPKDRMSARLHGTHETGVQAHSSRNRSAQLSKDAPSADRARSSTLKATTKPKAREERPSVTHTFTEDRVENQQFSDLKTARSCASPAARSAHELQSADYSRARSRSQKRRRSVKQRIVAFFCCCCTRN